MDTENKQQHSDLILDYIEGRLDPAQARDLETHMEQCDFCQKQAQELRRIIGTLREEKTAYCPEVWEIHEFHEAGLDPDGKISRHINACPMCSEELDSLKTPHADQALPGIVYERFQANYGKKRKVRAGNAGVLNDLIDRLRGILDQPGLALGSVAAVAILLIVLIPRDGAKIMAPMTSVEWNQGGAEGKWSSKGLRRGSDLNGTHAQQKAKLTKVAYIILLELGHGYEQSWIDSLYSDIRPKGPLNSSFEFITPASFTDPVSKAGEKISDIKEYLDELAQKEDVELALLINLKPGSGSFNVKVDLRQTRTGKTIVESSITDTPKAKLAKRLIETTSRLLENRAVGP